jgi:hypothetical protein
VDPRADFARPAATDEEATRAIDCLLLDKMLRELRAEGRDLAPDDAAGRPCRARSAS